MDDFYQGFMEGSKLKNDDKKAIARFVGFTAGKQVAVDFFANINMSIFGPDSTAAQSMSKQQFLAGFLAAAQNKHLYIEKDMAQIFAQTKGQEIQNKANEHLKTENFAFLESNKTKEGVITLPSGLQYKVEKEGAGPKPTAEDEIKVNYRGTDIHGIEFENNKDAVFGLSYVIAGWTEGFQLMPVGSKYILYIPYDLGYGEGGNPPVIKPYATLIFEVELLEIVKK
jgi:FKBP-type peptidyl-prolyl cis-trans isomerase FklB